MGVSDELDDIIKGEKGGQKQERKVNQNRAKQNYPKEQNNLCQMASSMLT